MYTYYPDPNNRSHIREEFVNFWSDYFFVAPQVRQKHLLSEFTGLWSKTGLWTRIWNLDPAGSGIFFAGRSRVFHAGSDSRFEPSLQSSIQCVTFQSHSRERVQGFFSSHLNWNPPPPPPPLAGNCVHPPLWFLRGTLAGGGGLLFGQRDRYCGNYMYLVPSIYFKNILISKSSRTGFTLKVPKCEILVSSDFHYFYTIKPFWVDDFVVKILTYYFNFWGSHASFIFWCVS
jgi:hypothetical protein